MSDDRVRPGLLALEGALVGVPRIAARTMLEASGVGAIDVLTLLDGRCGSEGGNDECEECGEVHDE